MKKLVVLLAGAFLAMSWAVAPALAQAQPMKIIGGGVGSFDAFPRAVSYFGVEATVPGDGTASGQFACAVVDFGVALGSFSTATVNADGSVQLQGTCSVFFVDGTEADDIDLSVTCVQGGPKVGKFIFAIPILPEPDHETLLFGNIAFK